MRSMCIAHLIYGLKSTNSRSMRRYAFASHLASDHQNWRKLMNSLLEIYEVLTLFVFIISPWSMRIFLRGNLLQEKARITIVIINNKCCKSLMTFFWVSEGLLKCFFELPFCIIYKTLTYLNYKLFFIINFCSFSELLCSLSSTQSLKELFERFLLMNIHKYFWTILIKSYMKIPWWSCFNLSYYFISKWHKIFK